MNWYERNLLPWLIDVACGMKSACEIVGIDLRTLQRRQAADGLVNNRP